MDSSAPSEERDGSSSSNLRAATPSGGTRSRRRKSSPRVAVEEAAPNVASSLEAAASKGFSQPPIEGQPIINLGATTVDSQLDLSRIDPESTVKIDGAAWSPDDGARDRRDVQPAARQTIPFMGAVVPPARVEQEDSWTPYQPTVADRPAGPSSPFRPKAPSEESDPRFLAIERLDAGRGAEPAALRGPSSNDEAADDDGDDDPTLHQRALSDSAANRALMRSGPDSVTRIHQSSPPPGPRVAPTGMADPKQTLLSPFELENRSQSDSIEVSVDGVDSGEHLAANALSSVEDGEGATVEIQSLTERGQVSDELSAEDLVPIESEPMVPTRPRAPSQPPLRDVPKVRAPEGTRPRLPSQPPTTPSAPPPPQSHASSVLPTSDEIRSLAASRPRAPSLPDVPPVRPRAPSVPLVAPPVAVSAAVTPSNPPMAPSQPTPIAANSAAPSSAVPSSAPSGATSASRPQVAAALRAPAPVPLELTQPVDASTRKLKPRGWWEELFNEDYLRATPPLSERVVKREVDFIEESLGVAQGATLLDLACGVGRHAVELGRRGYKVLGLDLSPVMVAKAQEASRAANVAVVFHQADMREMAFEDAFDGVCCWDTSFGYFDEEKNAQVIHGIRKALRKGGRLILDVVNRDYIMRQSPSVAWFEGDRCICMDEMQIDVITSRMRVKRTMILEDGRSREIEYSIRVYSLHELGRLLHECGFRVAEVSGRIATPGVFFGAESPRTLVLAEKR
jgi:SAM-dependent methyltransferase